MSELPKPPGTYILSKLHDVTVPPSVSWYPQTIGWKILAVGVFLVFLYIAYRLVRKWWVNRYRKEALEAISQLDVNDSEMPKTLFSILKIVLIHLDSRNAKLFDSAFLRKLDELNPQKHAFTDEVSKLWLGSLINPNIKLTGDQRTSLIEKARCWVKEHSQVTELGKTSSASKDFQGGHHE
ncbi:DUF4381 domain-containing protein [Vibrio sp. B1FLJ16]|uniref:DUF4381 domain-containing protein n=1 Tax=Vibrio sp. B1FLJ16 TaxID=2751178 RepID=UPI0015F46B47|nr:DUF4381 domain-containing protein [Vibrio sp. B1FLJ16]CAD7820044.1 hypothetical protein ACOMICROBIO_EPCKBFOG_03790 [Vibrio sp. B1FLJ16]CAD7821377.1 hypothetical protein ACOMICROBIO_FLGHMIGD_04348 [Vibrio sp. B1FLJ16]CAE6941597.1 hypothetical protein ACOMICROBIO_EPCKBFOG_03790 [Vibrio sp. B1FLJ16]CAE6945978.1 hypothetical protein ACOMICROBIO_FLGHMIGD_04348 [Vibrio sp. B1FLJ16]